MFKTLLFFLNLRYLQSTLTFHGVSWINQPGSLHVINNDGNIHTLAWLVVLKPNHLRHHKNVTPVANQFGLLNVGQVMWLDDHYIFVHPTYVNSTSLYDGLYRRRLYHKIKRTVETRLYQHDDIMSFTAEIFRQRSKRFSDDKNTVGQKISRTNNTINDPYFALQWYLQYDYLNVSGVWNYGVTGKGVTVCVVDDGLDWTNPDLFDAYNSAASWDIISNDPDPRPDYDIADSSHGTRCAGEIVAAANEFCGVGIAFGSNVSGIRILNKAVSDSMEAQAFSFLLDMNDVFSCSWGPTDDGMTVEGPMYLTEKAITRGVEIGRKGYGTIYVVASGNGHQRGDDCNYDGFASSPYTITVGAIDDNDEIAEFSEGCSCINAVTYGKGSTNNIITTDIMSQKNNKYYLKSTGCTSGHRGTSAAAPLASALIALMLEVNPCLSWRDVQYIIMFTAVKIAVNSSSWIQNSAGIIHSSFYGFGKLNAWYMTNIAKVWKSVPWSSTYTSPVVKVNKKIPFIPKTLNSTITVEESVVSSYGLKIVEVIQVAVTVSHPSRGSLQLSIVSPKHTVSVLAKPRRLDRSSQGLKQWKFSSLQFWGETPVGNWTLMVTDTGINGPGILRSWFLLLHGSPMTSQEFSQRKLFVEKYKIHNYLSDNASHECNLPQTSLMQDIAISPKVLQLLVVFGCAFFVYSLWDIIEAVYKNESVKVDEDLKNTSAEPLLDVGIDEHRLSDLNS